MGSETPMMQQYRAIKEQHQDAILFFRLGDFYEMFDEDAREAAQLLNLVLTARNGMPMCGIPFHASTSYIRRLITAGKKIAVCEQTELPEKGKGLAKREVVQIITPGTVVEEDFLDSVKSNYICCIEQRRSQLACAYAEMSTGLFHLTRLEAEESYQQMRSLLHKLQPAEIIVQESILHENPAFQKAVSGTRAMVTSYPDWYFSQRDSLRILTDHFGTVSLKQFGISDSDPLITPAGVLYTYIREHAKQQLSHIQSLAVVTADDYVLIDESAQRNLELVKNLQDSDEKYTLFSVLKHTRTAAGSRMLRDWMVNPLRSIERISHRQEQITSFYQHQAMLTSVRDTFSRVLDLQRICTRITMGRALPRDLQAVSQSIRALISLYSDNRSFFDPMIGDISRFEQLLPLAEELDAALYDEIGRDFEEGKIIRPGYSSELDRLRDVRDHGEQILAEYLQEIKAQTGLTNIKLKSNKIIGYFLEVSKAQSKLVPDEFLRKQTLVNGERYTTDRLIEIERQITGATVRTGETERQLYEQLLETAAAQRDLLLQLASVTAELDCYQSLAYAAMKFGYIRPEMTEENLLHIENGRHPVVESLMQPGEFVPNSLDIISDRRRTALITGPNMSGKSTYLRQTALIVLMAHIGSFVPADSAKIGLTDKIFCRVGASDNLARGESTFLVEMNETAFILRNATASSLVIMDEVGRGTSTRDGLSIAYAVLQRLLKTGSKTLFATHYHELTTVEAETMQKLYLDIAEEGGTMVFLNKIRPGVASSSYGIHAAELAGVPREVLRTARAYQKQRADDAGQPDLFTQSLTEEEVESLLEPDDQLKAEQIITRLQQLDTDETTPLEALSELYALKKLAAECESKS